MDPNPTYIYMWGWSPFGLLRGQRAENKIFFFFFFRKKKNFFCQNCPASKQDLGAPGPQGYYRGLRPLPKWPPFGGAQGYSKGTYWGSKIFWSKMRKSDVCPYSTRKSSRRPPIPRVGFVEGARVYTCIPPPGTPGLLRRQLWKNKKKKFFFSKKKKKNFFFFNFGYPRGTKKK